MSTKLNRRKETNDYAMGVAYQFGFSAHEIAAKAGCSHATVLDRLRSMGVPIRGKGRYRRAVEA